MAGTLRCTELTVMGKSLRVHFEQINRTRELVHATTRAATSGEVAELNIGLMCTVGSKLLVGMLEHFLKQHPGISIILHDVTSDAIEDVLKTG